MTKKGTSKYEFDFTGYSVQDHIDFRSLAEKLTISSPVASDLFAGQSVQCPISSEDTWAYVKFSARFLVRPTLAEISLEVLPGLITEFTDALARRVLGVSEKCA